MLSTIFTGIKIYAGIGAVISVSSYLYYEYPEPPYNILLPTVFGLVWPFSLLALYNVPELRSRDIRLWPQEIRQIIESNVIDPTDADPTE